MNMPMPSRFIPNANDCQMVSEGRADELSRSDKQRILFDIPEALRFRIDLRQCLALLKGDLYTRQRQSQGDDMLFTLVFPGKQLWKYPVSNILGLLSDFLVQSTHVTFTFMTCVWRLLQEKVSCCSTHFWMWHLYVVVRR